MTDAKGDAWVRVAVRPGVELGAELQSATGEPLTGCVNVWVEKGIGTVHAIFPEPGTYEMVLYTRRPPEETGWEAGRLGFNASEATTYDIRFSNSATVFAIDEGDNGEEEEEEGAESEPESLTP